MSNTQNWVVLKFGGTSVKSLADWRVISKRIADVRAEGKRVFVVHSAVATISDLLDTLVTRAVAGEGEAELAAIKARHMELATELGVEGEALLAPYFDELDRLRAGLSLTGDVSPRLKARIMAQGELMATTLGQAWLAREGVASAWLDARDHLTAAHASGARGYLACDCPFDADAHLQRTLADLPPVIVTQGFIARREDGDTALLGRGGSDTSASYFAAKLGAERIEIWTDVPGFFSADPRLTGAARQIRSLAYEEAQELASMGAGVLHPRAIGPVRRAGIEMQVLCTHRPEMTGTTISATPSEDTPRMKAVSVKHGVRLITLETDGMWRASGFLARAFEPFSRHGVSIDLVSTSETSVTVSLDDDPGLTPDVLGALEDELSQIASVKLIEDCAAVSMVGRGVRALLAQLGPAMEAFAHYPVRLVSQAANDLNLTVVVDGDQGRPLCRRLHDQLIQPKPRDKTFGPSWREIGENLTEAAPAGAGTWWRNKRQALLDLCPADGAVYVYDLETVRTRAEAVSGLKHLDRGWYAMKANGHPDMIRTAVAAGLGVECVSINEVRAARDAVPGLEADRILFTPNFAPKAEYAEALELGVHVTLDGLHPLRAWPEIFKGRKITLRINPQRPEGHHKHVRTAGPEAKFGLHADELDEARTLAADAGAIVNGLHVHSGSGISDPDHWRRVGLFLVETARSMPDVEILDLGGGLSVDEASGVRRIDMAALDAVLGDLKTAHPQYQLWIEPGRYISAEAGVLLARVTQLKHTPDARFIGLNTGMNSLIRPALYGARHEIVNLTRLDEDAAWIADIVGPICETADRLGAQRLMPETQEGDVMLIANGGAYGRVMSSSYNMREPAGEVAI
ncbi:bifunctional aspartate kinase/diaminopimelate decarboxylase [Maricaulis sp.]|uniref:bifunctional aspartate kinase/diaminopimelate decarboxylase n=1 Tax=Maricaulis sp. TaxID=1486257 RepID=UPI001B28D778|nr:bifunctional aspartate kinase/diaminopimelate decarboxylase [Maricaulis sp.]MBO6764586.1 bifunctional aspartate kinase/diaminopimelate decarboxylase [Maricaulis sp.]